jgi:predicted kinase
MLLDSNLQSKLVCDILVGPIGAGKSTWSRAQIDKDPSIMVVSKDSIRQMLFAGIYDYKEQHEPMVRRIAEAATLQALSHRCSVILDEPHFKRDTRTSMITTIREFFPKGTVVIRYVVFKWGEFCLERRKADPKGLPPKRWEKVYKLMVDGYEPPAPDEGYDELLQVDTDPVVKPGLAKPIDHIAQSVRAQTQYCKIAGLPVMVPPEGMCPGCKRQIFSHFPTRDKAGSEMITGCPFCHWSFV